LKNQTLLKRVFGGSSDYAYVARDRNGKKIIPEESNPPQIGWANWFEIRGDETGAPGGKSSWGVAQTLQNINKNLHVLGRGEKVPHLRREDLSGTRNFF